MARFPQPPDDFICPYRHACPYLEGLSTEWLWHCYQHDDCATGQYEYQLEQLRQEVSERDHRIDELQKQNAQLKAQLQALHHSQFKGRRMPPAKPTSQAGNQPKKRGAPAGHPPWQRAKPKHIDAIVPVPAPEACPHCHGKNLQPVEQVHNHVQEDIVLAPRTVATCFLHQLAYCPVCECNVLQPGPGELLGAYIGPAAKATAIYMRYELNVSDRKISRFFAEFFGLKFVPASAFGFERQAVRRGLSLYEDLLDKVRSLAVVHADETSWRQDGKGFWVWFAGDDDLAAFHWDEHRSAEAAQVLLGEHFPGTLVADAYASYNGVHPKHRQSCLAHIKTKAKELGQELALLKGSASDPQARQFVENVQGLVHRACQAHHRLSQGPWRAKAAKKQGRLLRAQLRRLCSRPLRSARAESFRRRLLDKEQDRLFTCFDRPNVSPTNNLAERSLRPVVIMRRVIQGTRSEKGLENHSVLRSLVETAKRQGKKVHLFLLDLFTKHTADAQAALYQNPLSKPSKRPRAEKPP